MNPEYVSSHPFCNISSWTGTAMIQHKMVCIDTLNPASSKTLCSGNTLITMTSTEHSGFSFFLGALPFFQQHIHADVKENITAHSTPLLIHCVCVCVVWCGVVWWGGGGGSAFPRTQGKLCDKLLYIMIKTKHIMWGWCHCVTLQLKLPIGPCDGLLPNQYQPPPEPMITLTSAKLLSNV